MWIKQQLEDFGLKINKVPLLCDNTSEINLTKNQVQHSRTKHIEIDCYFIREKIQEGLVQTSHISTSEQLADILTKSLGIQQHEYLASKLGIKDVFQLPTWGGVLVVRNSYKFVILLDIVNS